VFISFVSARGNPDDVTGSFCVAASCLSSKSAVANSLLLSSMVT
jgi:hypothetical protein